MYSRLFRARRPIPPGLPGASDTHVPAQRRAAYVAEPQPGAAACRALTRVCIGRVVDARARCDADERSSGHVVNSPADDVPLCDAWRSGGESGRDAS